MQHVERAPAKINLSLRVLGRRADGFHELQTLMAALDGLEDELAFDLRAGGGGVELRCDDRSLPLGDENLVIKALRAYQQASGNEFEGTIDLVKRIPHGAGLGGGSSDAAATLRVLDRMGGGTLGQQKLTELAASIGSDVAFFVDGRPALCRGRGELIEHWEGQFSRQRVLLIKPQFGVSSAWAYSRWQRSAELPGVDYGPQEAPWGEAVNDLERPVFEKHLVLAAIKMWLLAEPETGTVLMSGSGSTLLATLKEGGDAEALATAVQVEFGASTWIHEAAIAAPGDG